MCIELMLNGVNLAFVAFNRAAPGGSLDGQVLVFFVMVVRRRRRRSVSPSSSPSTGTATRSTWTPSA